MINEGLTASLESSRQHFGARLWLVRLNIKMLT